ncbi:hypothetical protein CYMTET_54166 [Cymbomonas tetramitiformis]|uniref:YHYH domain-containing protein n=1 Tax=Cymbomonas tetramitiformis TaxID=36881 RepID=A0AAE0ER02_9CHLO|nr:hypothetical protein CYMTET_54166 [Cymbomonas tetramitiformis]
MTKTLQARLEVGQEVVGALLQEGATPRPKEKARTQTAKHLLRAPNHLAPAPPLGLITSATTIPGSSYTNAPVAAPTLGRIGMSISGGVNIYGPFEAGFTTGQACSNGLGDCAGGVDVPTCEKELEYECGTSAVKYSMLLDSCGGHAMPYHYHADLSCVYTASDSSSHSPLVGVGLDGRGLYGLWEDSGEYPSLDACNGHTGPVPEDSTYGTSGSTVYHYHTTAKAPFTIGCYGEFL